MERKTFCLFIIMCLGIQRVTSDILRQQKRNWVIEWFTFDEDYVGPFPLLLGKVGIDTSSVILDLHGPGVDEEPRNLIQIDSSTAEVWILGPVDREEYDMFKLIFQAVKKDKIQTQLGIDINIRDINDNEPTFGNQMYEVTLEKTPAQGTGLVNVTATDKDSTEKNRNFSFSIESVTPTPQSFEFIINKEPHFANGTISFKGCLDHEKAQKYTLSVKVTDRGHPKPLFGSTTVVINVEDGNRHLPEFTQQNGQASVKEGLQGVLISRLPVTDLDTRGSKAWKAKYKIQGDTDSNFRIYTDPETNDGLLYVTKKLDYEEHSMKNLIVTVENEISYFTCKVMDRNTGGLWKVETLKVAQNGTGTEKTRLSTYYLTVNIEDVNEPPVFHPPNKTVTVSEDAALGYYLETFIATDPDVRSANVIRYKIGEDPAGYVTVDSKTGKIITSNSLDRESEFVKNGLYIVTIHAVDNGEPSQTGTATLSIKIIDVNDNAPSLDRSNIDMCQNDSISSVSVTAADPDGEPYSGPFSFRLLGDVENKWRIDTENGYLFKLVKEQTIFWGHHDLQLEVLDLQGKKAIHNLSVIVCKCFKTTRPDCQFQDPKSRLGPTALGILFLSMILLTGLLLLTFLISCKTEKTPFPDQNLQSYLTLDNTEGPGTDCKVPLKYLHLHNNHSNNGQQAQMSPNKPLIEKTVLVEVNSHQGQNKMSCQQAAISGIHFSEASMQQQGMFLHGSSSSAIINTHQQVWMQQSQHAQEVLLHNILKTKLLRLEAPGEEVDDYEPITYADEGGSEHSFELDVLSNPEVSFGQDIELDNNFLPLASICLPNMFAKS